MYLFLRLHLTLLHLIGPYSRFHVLHVNPKTVHKVLIEPDPSHSIYLELFSLANLSKLHLSCGVEGKA
ncbi:hypothetical protein HanXRQr2_Chr03g0124331 [Helianthus annuus]|uniref:Uncharacterized protein n=1 Tax=Helianthus annuus TaxID=4232 RepID=A0A9K3JHZ8_HELAN|nr:hypothetical protein HanXRQr2_Chr03g0124331 [Helianthus annuus]KAJ0944823.1 hypothetical protein HanPSC8_Chr03g0121071 [Helianthus annuus]